MKKLLIALVLLSACSTGKWTKSGIALNLDAGLKNYQPEHATIYALRCDPVYWAMETCVKEGYAETCAWDDSFNDRDHDYYTIAVCAQRYHEDQKK